MSGRQTKKVSKLENGPKPKILMLHGYRQNEMAFRERSGGLRKALKNQAEFVFCEAPHVVKDKEEIKKEGVDGGSEVVKGWWFSKEDGSYDALETTDCQNGFEESLAYLDNVFETQGPFDGILAFSQGACLASILCRISQQNSSSQESVKFKFIKFKFAIIVAGFKSGQVQHEIYYDKYKKIDLPSLHVIGKADKVIPFEMSMALTEYFTNPSVFVHDLGHYIPVNAESKNAFTQFLTQFSNSQN